MPITLEGPAAVLELPAGDKLLVIIPGEGLEVHIPMPKEAAREIGRQLQGTGVVMPPPGFMNGPNPGGG